jgi:hypothetical protein
LNIDASDTIDADVEVTDDVAIVQRWTVRQIFATLAIVPLLVAYVIVVRSSDHVVRFVDLLRRNAAPMMLLVALVVAITWRLAPPLLRRLESRVRGNIATRTVVVSTGLALTITPAMVSWLTARWAYSKIGGVIPWADASAYQIGGSRLLHQGRLDAFNMRRPWNAGFYAVRMSLTGQNFWASMLLQGLLVGLSAMLLLGVLAKRLGLPACLAAAAVLFAFVEPVIDLTLSESLGLTLGCLAAAALCEGVSTRRSWLFALGLLELTVALNVRAGAYLMLPALLIWLFVDTLRSHLPLWKPMLMAVGAVVAGFALVLPMNALYGSGAGSVNGNFSYVLYGLAHGGTGWDSAFAEFNPKDFDSEKAMTDAIYDAAIAEIRAHPGKLVQGLLRGYGKYAEEGVYGYASSPISVTLLILMAIGWVPLLSRGPLRRLGSMVFAAWLGFLVSVPFVFPDGGFRVIAVVVPLLAIPPAAGVALIARRGLRAMVNVPSFDSAFDVHRIRLIAAASLGSVAVLVLGPPVVRALYDSPAIPEVKCPHGEVPVVAYMGRNVAHVTLVAAGHTPRNFGEMTATQFHDLSYAGPQTEIGKALSFISAGSVFVSTDNLIAGSRPTVLAVVPEDEYPGDQKLVAFCGRPADDSVAAFYGVMSTHDVEVLDP